MLALRRNWQLFRCSVPGRRFQDWYWHRCRARAHGNSRGERALHVLGGAAILVAGVAMLATPGPGWLAIGLGAGLLAGESLRLARLLDRLELRLRQLARRIGETWRRASPLAKTGLIILTTAVVAAVTCGLYLLMLR